MAAIKEKSAEKSGAKINRVKVTKKSAEESTKKSVANSIQPLYILQYQASEIHLNKLADRVKKAYLEAKEPHGAMKKLEIYLKPEEGAAYYVVNGFGSDEQKIPL